MSDTTSRIDDRIFRRAVLVLGTAALALVAGACAGSPPQPSTLAVEDGARIWRNTCNRCHNMRPTDEYTSREWPVIVAHMRTRAHLTRPEAEAVTAFLQELAAEP